MNLTLFSDAPHPRHRRTDPVTSVAAARSVVPAEDRILAVMGVTPLTADQIAARLPRVRRDTLRSALSRLKNDGRVIAAGEGVSDAGRRMTQWRRA